MRQVERLEKSEIINEYKKQTQDLKERITTLEVCSMSMHAYRDHFSWLSSLIRIYILSHVEGNSHSVE